MAVVSTPVSAPLTVRVSGASCSGFAGSGSCGSVGSSNAGVWLDGTPGMGGSSSCAAFATVFSATFFAALAGLLGSMRSPSSVCRGGGRGVPIALPATPCRSAQWGPVGGHGHPTAGHLRPVTAASTTTMADVRRVTRDVFGHDRLFPGQEQAVRALLEGRDVLFVSATGSGKSLTYQVAGVVIDGCTVVVSPLLALQKDQLDGLPEHAGTRGVRLSSSETESQRREALDRAVRGEVEFVALSPEQLANDEVRSRLKDLRPSLVAVDEAHCVSTWGHAFRPDYLRLGDLLEEVGSPQVIALTATAAAPVRDDIVERLHLREPHVVVAGFGRDNIELRVQRCVERSDQE